MHYSVEAHMNPKMIVIDGKTYHSVEEMPPDVRQKYEQAMQALGDANGNHIPDAFETVSSETVDFLADKDKNGAPDIIDHLVAGQSVISSMKIIIDGKEFNGMDNLPPEARAKYEAAIGKMDANKNGIPDFVEGMLNPATPNQSRPVAAGYPVQTPRASSPIPDSPTITPDTSNGLMLALSGLFVLFLCAIAAGAVWYFFLR
jgi:hypothetical protein